MVDYNIFALGKRVLGQKTFLNRNEYIVKKVEIIRRRDAYELSVVDG